MRLSTRQLFVGGAIVSSAAVALAAADAWTSTFVIDYLDNDAMGTLYVVIPDGLSFNGANNPANCAGTTQALPHSSLDTAAEKDLVASTLMFAWQAKRPVRLRLHGTDCTLGNPAYYAVSMDNDD